MAVTTNQGFTLPTVGGSTDSWGTDLNSNWTALDTLLGSVAAADLTKLVAVTASAAELNVLDGITSTTAQLNLLGSITATAAELNILDGVTASTAEINYVDGVTSNIQTQLDNRVTANADDALTGGYTTTSVDDGTKSSGTYTPSPSGGNMRRIVNGGAFTLAAPTASGDYTMVIQMTNSATAGAVTVSGFSKVTGDAISTTSGHDFFVFITKCNGFTSASIQALQ